MLKVPYSIREQDPLKQGLKHPNSSCCCPSPIIREQDPLKQGLKPNAYGKLISTTKEIREQDPLKQGLKP